MLSGKKSITQTRLHFQNIVAGFTPEDEARYVDWKEDFTSHPPKPGEETKASRKGKERLSAGGGDGVAGSSNTGSPGRVKATREKGSNAAGSGASQAKKKRRSGGM